MWTESSGPSADLWCVLFCVSAGCQAVWSQRKAVLLWPQLWTPTPPIWESWTWATIIQETQEWSSCLLDWSIQAADWTLSGRKSPAAVTDSYDQFPLDTSLLRYVSAMPAEQINFTLIYVLIPTRSAALHICSVPASAAQSPPAQFYFWRIP